MDAKLWPTMAAIFGPDCATVTSATEEEKEIFVAKFSLGGRELSETGNRDTTSAC